MVQRVNRDSREMRALSLVENDVYMAAEGHTTNS